MCVMRDARFISINMQELDLVSLPLTHGCIYQITVTFKKASRFKIEKAPEYHSQYSRAWAYKHMAYDGPLDTQNHKK